VSETSFAVTVEQISPVKTKLSFDIPGKRCARVSTMCTAGGENSQDKGFRPGKIPRHVLEMYYKESAEEETAANLINKYYLDA